MARKYDLISELYDRTCKTVVSSPQNWETCLTEAALVRLLVRGYEPKERPDERFYDVMRQLSSIGNNINQLAAQANSLSFVDAQKLQKEAERWHKFQADVERQFLRPEKSEMKWQ